MKETQNVGRQSKRLIDNVKDDTADLGLIPDMGSYPISGILSGILSYLITA